MRHVLVTRPFESSQQLAVGLDAAGLVPIVMPLYSFAAREPGADMHSAWSGASARRLAVFTSPRAVQFGLPHIPENQFDGLELAVVGNATRARLESSGHPVHLQASSGFTSEDLLSLPTLASEPGEALIFCAPGGRQTLKEGLETLGWKVGQAMVYERVTLEPQPEQVDALMAAQDLLSVWTSISALKLAEQYLPETAWDRILGAPALVISSRIQHHLQQLGLSRVELADGPGNPELLRSILRMTGPQTTG